MNDPITDLLNRIRNACNARHKTVMVPSSGIKEAIVQVLKKEGFISNYVKEEKKPQDELIIFLTYDAKKKSVIRKMTRISSPGSRVYRKCREIFPFLSGMGVTILSTPKGILSDKEARKSNVGGEVLCEVW